MKSYSEAIREAVEDVAKKCITVHYPSGHVDNVETAVRRAVLSGDNKGTNDISLGASRRARRRFNTNISTPRCSNWR